MGIWKECLLGDIITFQRGYDLPKTKMNGGIYPVVASNGIIGYHNKFTTEEPSITIGRSGNVGKPLLIKGKSWSHNTTLYIKEYKNVAPLFIYYLLKTIDLKNYAGGSAVPTLNRNHIHCLPVKIPTDILIQKQIVSILSSYDNLMENNQKQIKLLEELAQRLYKEWFVDLHFPDYENTPVVDGIPEGWQIGRLDELGEFKRGKTITKESVLEGDVPVVAGGLKPAYYHNIANATAPVITVSGSGANAGFTRMYHIDVWASDCSFVDINSTNHIYQIYCYLKANKADLKRLQKGSAQPHVYAKDINAMQCLIPDKKIAIQFNKFVSSIFTKIGKLYEEIEKLKEARDRLLPNLMNSEIDVSEIQI